MTVIPITIKRANEIVKDWHRHNKPTVGGKFALGAEHDGKLVGVVIVGRPIARMLAKETNAEVTRLCTIPDAPKNACSFLYGAARRAWFTMGGKKLITYTLGSESGSSLRGAGWEAKATVKGQQWTRESRVREEQQVFMHDKIRWETKATP